MNNTQEIEELILKLTSQVKSVRNNALDLLIAMGEPATYHLIEVLDNSQNCQVRSAIIEVLGTIGRPAVYPILQAFDETDGNIQWDLIKALSAVGEPAVEPLLQLLENGDEVEAANAARTLGMMGNTQAVKPLITTLQDNENDHVRSCAAEALGEIGAAESVDTLIASLNDSDRYVRNCSAVALGKIGDRKAVHPLIELLKDEDFKVRAAAAESLAKIGDERAVVPLIQALDSKGGGFYFSAHEVIMSAILKFHMESTAELLIEALKGDNTAIKEHASRTLSKMGNVAFPPLVRALNDENVETRYYAAHSLGLMADGKAKIPLIRVAASENEDEDVKREARKALCKIT